VEYESECGGLLFHRLVVKCGKVKTMFPLVGPLSEPASLKNGVNNLPMFGSHGGLKKGLNPNISSYFFPFFIIFKVNKFDERNQL